ncbi:NADP-dependent oxidoreductase [Rhodococcus triatomae]|uniref:NADPH:quinone reductase n=1 Tax=Rhodococcus triatomae TaxID=300028 RepID=A0A1G8HPM2_9NOCA|nr:NADP-dependent oxidoreductase [Rhodococcus triatomae]QNG20845.1 NADP-dependent oxidoreductase [Rhodococcus triatomae]QNG23240.1 NADP-dependent oxidoreductase [Rhodococcus triatomae]SDI08627.1 NADPH:quinone reductase [Rhodococcus triatomae]
MRAAVVHTPGGVESIELVDVPVPTPGRGEIRIAVAAAGVNPVDLATRRGLFHDLGVLTPGTPVGLGWEVAGTVDAVGTDVGTFRVGDRVAALVTDLSAPLAGYAEYLVVGADAAATLPDDLELTAAATLPLSALTADQALTTSGVRAGETLLVTGAGGMVGGYLVQLAARQGVEVIALATDADEPVLREFGARAVLDRDIDVPAAVRALRPAGVDAVVDAANIAAPAVDSLRPDGTYVGLLPAFAPTAPRVHVATVEVRADGRRLAELARSGLTARVAEVVPLADVRRAHEIAEKGGLRGRLVLVP